MTIATLSPMPRILPLTRPDELLPSKPALTAFERQVLSVARLLVGKGTYQFWDTRLGRYGKLVSVSKPIHIFIALKERGVKFDFSLTLDHIKAAQKVRRGSLKIIIPIDATDNLGAPRRSPLTAKLHLQRAG